MQGRKQHNGEAQAQAASAVSGVEGYKGSWPLKGVHGRTIPEAHELYKRNGDDFDRFRSAFNNMKFRLFCPFFDNTTTD